MKASILRSDKPNLVKVITPFLRAFVTELKEKIPSSHRQWNPTEKHWLVNDTYLEELIELLKKHYQDIETDLLQPREGVNGGSYATLFLLPSSPDELVKSAYKLLSFKFHPDMQGGSDEEMKKLNIAFDNIRKERGF